jgi:Replication regulatory protein RepB.
MGFLKRLFQRGRPHTKKTSTTKKPAADRHSKSRLTLRLAPDTKGRFHEYCRERGLTYVDVLEPYIESLLLQKRLGKLRARIKL